MTQVGVEEGTAVLGELRSAIDKVRSTGVQRVADVPPALLASLKISADVPPAEARERVRAGLFALAERLDPDLRRAFLESAGFRRDAAPAAGDRIKATATMLGTSERTAYRRVDEAVAEMALLLQSRDGRPALVDLDYVFLRSHFRVDLTGDAPLMVMERTISARSDGVSRIDERVNLPRMRHQQLHFRALEGCRVESNNFLTPGMWAITLSFPRPLKSTRSQCPSAFPTMTRSNRSWGSFPTPPATTPPSTCSSATADRWRWRGFRRLPPWGTCPRSRARSRWSRALPAITSRSRP